MNRVRYFLILSDPLVWLWLVIARAMWGGTLERESGVLVWRFPLASWFARTFYKKFSGTTLGHAMMIREGGDGIMFHEFQHVEQAEANGLVGVVVCAVFAGNGHPIWGLALWLAMPLLVYGAASLIAMLYGKSGYRGNLFEVAAYDRDRVRAIEVDQTLPQ